MKCINCLHKKTEVFNSRTRQKDDTIWRRRRCKACQFVFSTEEYVPLEAIYTVTNDKDIKNAKPFLMSKLTASLSRSIAAVNSPATSSEDAYWLGQSIRQKVINTYRPVRALLSSSIASLCLEVLIAYNPLAASVYARQRGLPEPIKSRGRPRRT